MQGAAGDAKDHTKEAVSSAGDAREAKKDAAMVNPGLPVCLCQRHDKMKQTAQPVMLQTDAGDKLATE